MFIFPGRDALALPADNQKVRHRFPAMVRALAARERSKAGAFLRQVQVSLKSLWWRRCNAARFVAARNAIALANVGQKNCPARIKKQEHRTRQAPSGKEIS
jgi:hypothetical protein